MIDRKKDAIFFGFLIRYYIQLKEDSFVPNLKWIDALYGTDSEQLAKRNIWL